VIECKKQFLESRIRVKDVKGRLRDAHVILAMANGQIKGVGDADKCTRIGSIKKWLLCWGFYWVVVVKMSGVCNEVEASLPLSGIMNRDLELSAYCLHYNCK